MEAEGLEKAFCSSQALPSPPRLGVASQAAFLCLHLCGLFNLPQNQLIPAGSRDGAHQWGISQEISEVPRLKDRFGKQLGDSEEGIPLPQAGCGEMGKPTGRKERGAVWLTAKTCWNSLVKNSQAS